MNALRLTSSFILMPSLALAMLISLGGCYEKVVSTRQYPGMHMANGASTPTAHDYSNVKMHNPNEGSNFDPIGAVFNPLASVARGIGNVGSALGDGLSSGNNDGNGNANNNNNSNSNSGNNRSNGGSRPPTADPGGGIGASPFDTAPK